MYREWNDGWNERSKDIRNDMEMVAQKKEHIGNDLKIISFLK